MPKVVAFSPRLDSLIENQDWVLARHQALSHGLTRHVIGHRLAQREWQVILPSVYLCHPGEPSTRQKLIAALLYAGDDAAIDGANACRYHGVKAIAVNDDLIDVVVPWGSPTRSHGFVRIRRTTRPYVVVRSERVSYVEPAVAVIAACRRLKTERAVVAALSDALQRRAVTEGDLLRAHALGSPRHAALTGRGLEHVCAGVRSLPEKDARLILESSHLLPRPVYNCLLRLPCGRLISPDALIVDAGLVHETNGRRAHAREDLFEDMQERHDAMTAAGLTVLHNTPRRLWRDGPQVLVEAERCYLRLAGQGLPEGVEIVRLAA